MGDCGWLDGLIGRLSAIQSGRWCEECPAIRPVRAGPGEGISRLGTGWLCWQSTADNSPIFPAKQGKYRDSCAADWGMLRSNVVKTAVYPRLPLSGTSKDQGIY